MSLQQYIDRRSRIIIHYHGNELLAAITPVAIQKPLIEQSMLKEVDYVIPKPMVSLINTQVYPTKRLNPSEYGMQVVITHPPGSFSIHSFLEEQGLSIKIPTQSHIFNKSKLPVVQANMRYFAIPVSLGMGHKLSGKTLFNIQSAARNRGFDIIAVMGWGESSPYPEGIRVANPKGELPELIWALLNSDAVIGPLNDSVILSLLLGLRTFWFPIPQTALLVDATTIFPWGFQCPMTNMLPKCLDCTSHKNCVLDCLGRVDWTNVIDGIV